MRKLYYLDEFMSVRKIIQIFFYNIISFQNIPMLLFLFFLTSIQLSGDAISVSEIQSQERIGKYLSVLEDPKIEFTPEDIIDGKKEANFKPINDSIPNFGFTKSQFWIKLDLYNGSKVDNDYLVEIEFAGLDDVELLFKDKQNKIIQYKTGDSLIFNSRQVSHKNFLFPIKINPTENQTYYLRVKSQTTLTIPINIWNHKDFYIRDYKLLFLFGSFFGIISIMILFFHLLYYSFNDKSFLYYSIYILFSAIFLGTYYGFTFQYIVPNFPAVNSYILLFSAITALLFSILFARDFLQIDSFHQNLNYLFKFFLYLGLILFVLFLFTNFSFSAQSITAYAIIWQIVSSIVTFYLAIRKNLYAMFYSFASILIVLFLTFSLLSNFNLYPRTTYTLYGFLFAYSFEIIIFSFGMGYKVQMIRREKTEIEKKSNEVREQLNSIQMEINTASRIHRTILPSGVPKIEGLDMYAVYIPSNTIGGDFYDFYQKDMIYLNLI